jgi:hypothetical protein
MAGERYGFWPRGLRRRRRLLGSKRKIFCSIRALPVLTDAVEKRHGVAVFAIEGAFSAYS